ncbi:MAG: RDD family protein [Actinophytocola sp.]|nr:RDD family protein [Actinophytocola sp.]
MNAVSPLVTGEAVELELRHARLASRAVAFGIDVLVQVVVLTVLYAVILTQAEFDTALRVTVVLLIFILVVIGYPVLFETLSRGRTLGKLAMGLKVVRDDGGPIRFRHALVRGLAGFFVDFWVVSGFVAVIVSLSSERGKRVGDFLAGTVVISLRVPQPDTGLVEMPQPLAGWAAQLDLSGLPDGLALAMRQYLGRYPTLSPGPRDALGERLAAEVADHIGAPPPPFTPPWAYLSAVLAERRTREQVRTVPPQPPAQPPPHDQAPPSPPSLSGEQRPGPTPDNPFTAPG